MKFNIVLFCAFHCTFDDFVSNYYIRKFAKARMILENLSLSVTCPQLINLHQQFFFFFFEGGESFNVDFLFFCNFKQKKIPMF